MVVWSQGCSFTVQQMGHFQESTPFYSNSLSFIFNTYISETWSHELWLTLSNTLDDLEKLIWIEENIYLIYICVFVKILFLFFFMHCVSPDWHKSGIYIFYCPLVIFTGHGNNYGGRGILLAIKLIFSMFLCKLYRLYRKPLTYSPIKSSKHLYPQEVLIDR